MRLVPLPKLRVPDLGIGPQILVVLLVIGLVGAMAIEPTRQLLAQRQRIDGMLGDLEGLNRTNQRLERRIERLQDPDFIEQLARAQANLVRPGEVPFVVLPPSRQAQAAERKRLAERQKAKTPPPPEPGLIEGFLSFIGLG